MGEALNDGNASCGDTFTSYSEILDARAGGENWGALKKSCGVNGGDLAPGRVISAQHRHQEETTTQSAVHGNSDNAHGNSGNNPGNGGNPPGQDKDKGKDNNPGQSHGKGK
jgi:hypothetical protein